MKKKMFFLKKKNQKTFAPGAKGASKSRLDRVAQKKSKFFCFFLFTKRSASIS